MLESHSKRSAGACAVVATHVVIRNIANLHKQPTANSPLETQARLNEIVQLEAEKDGFCRVIMASDNYAGWIDRRALIPIEDCNHLGIEAGAASQAALKTAIVIKLFADLLNEPSATATIQTKLTMGTKIYLAETSAAGQYFKIALPSKQYGYIAKDAVALGSPPYKLPEQVSAAAVEIALQFLGTPYLWGGTTPFGIDCSGLIQLCFFMAGVQMPRDSYVQAADPRFTKIESGKTLRKGDFQPGDLLAFGHSEKVDHIGFALGNGSFIHASGPHRNNGCYINSCTVAEYNEQLLSASRLSSISDFVHSDSCANLR